MDATDTVYVGSGLATRKVLRTCFKSPVSSRGSYYLWSDSDEEFYQAVCGASARLWSEQSTCGDENHHHPDPDPIAHNTHQMAALLETVIRPESSMQILSYFGPFNEAQFPVIYELLGDYVKHDRRPPFTVLVLLIRGYLPLMNSRVTATARRIWAKLTQFILGRQWLTLENSVTLSRYWWWAADYWSEPLRVFITTRQITAKVRKQMREPEVQRDVFRFFGKDQALEWVYQLQTNETPPQKVYERVPSTPSSPPPP